MTNNDDDELMAQLGAALAEARDVPPGFGRSGRELYTWLTVDAELAELAHDSLRSDQAAPVRSTVADHGPRSLTFRTPALTIDLDVEPAGLRGQLVAAPDRPVPAEVIVQPLGGEPLTAPVDGVGYFEIAPFPFSGKRFRLVCGEVVTPWID